MKNSYLSNESIFLRAVEPEDLDVMYGIENNPELWEVTSTTVPYSRFVLRQYIESTQSDLFADKQLRLMIARQSDGQTIGTIDLTDFSPLHNRAALGLAISAEYRNEGYASSALELVINYALNFLHMHQLYAHISSSNIGSIRVFEKLGFAKTSILKDWVRVGDEYEDAFVYQLIARNEPSR